MRQHGGGGTTRREFLTRGAQVAGAVAGGSLLTSFLASCSRPTQPALAPGVQSPNALETSGVTIAEARKANIQWDRFKGTVLNIALNKHPFQESLQPLLPEFEQLTGMKVQFSVLPEEQYFDKVTLDLNSRQGGFDVVMSGPMMNWLYASADNLANLDEFLTDSQLTDKNWFDVNDFYAPQIASNRWNKTIGSGVGEGPLWALPVMVETYMTAYRRDLFDKAGIKEMPKTWRGVFDIMPEIAKAGGGAQNNFYPMINRGTRAAATISTGFLSGLVTKGGSDLSDKLVPQCNSEIGMEHSAMWADMMKRFGPPGWTEITWYDGMNRMASGNFGLYMDCDFFATTYENPSKSQVAGKMGYALMPEGPNGGKALSHLWTWALSVNNSAKNKKAAWLFVQWATSRATLLNATTKFGNLNPTRKSVWEHPDVVNLMKNWGGGTYRSTVELNLAERAKVRWTPQPLYNEVGTIWAQALQELYGGRPTKATLDQAAKEIVNRLKQAGIA